MELNKIAHVVAIGLSVEEGVFVRLFAALDDERNGEILNEVEALAEQVGIEESAGGAAVAIDERMHIGYHEVDNDGAQDGVDERFVVRVVEVGAEFIDKSRDVGVRRWSVYHFVGDAVFHHHGIVLSKSSSIIRILERAFRHHGVKGQK